MGRASNVCLLIFTLLATAFGSAARADFIVTVAPNTNLAVGSSGYVPVYISSTAGDLLQNTSFEFQVTTGGSTRLEFTGSPAPASDPTFSNSSYVFFGNSSDQTNASPLGASSQTVVPGDTFIGGDFTLGNNVVVPGSNVLLAELPVTSLTGLPPSVGDTFTISLVPTSGSGFSGNTGFGDSDFNFGNFTSIAGTVTIVAATVPEPAAWILGLVALGACVIGLVQRRLGSIVRSVQRMGGFESTVPSIAK